LKTNVIYSRARNQRIRSEHWLIGDFILLFVLQCVPGRSSSDYCPLSKAGWEHVSI